MGIFAEVDLPKLIDFYAECERVGIGYGLGAKAPKMSFPPDRIEKIDCSGFVRWALFHATGGALLLPDGSQNQREWCEWKERNGHMRKTSSYENAARYMTDSRLFICFIKPGVNGCGNVGHVWLLCNADNENGADTIESCGGRGVTSRRWDTLVLRRQVYSVFELPTRDVKAASPKK